MADHDTVRRIARKLPGAQEEKGRFAFHVVNKGRPKGFVWVWLERTHPKKARVPNPAVLAVRVAGEADKAALLDADPDKFFTEPHYNGFPAVLVRLAAVTDAELESLIVEAWRCQAPKSLLAARPATPPLRPARRRPRRSP